MIRYPGTPSPGFVVYNGGMYETIHVELCRLQVDLYTKFNIKFEMESWTDLLNQTDIVGTTEGVRWFLLIVGVTFSLILNLVEEIDDFICVWLYGI